MSNSTSSQMRLASENRTSGNIPGEIENFLRVLEELCELQTEHDEHGDEQEETDLVRG